MFTLVMCFYFILQLFFSALGWHYVAPESPFAVWNIYPPSKLCKFFFYCHCLVTSFSFFNFAQPCFPSFFSLLLGSFLFSQFVEIKEEIFIGPHVSVGARMGSWHVEQWEYPVLMLSLTCQVRGQRLCVWGKWLRRHGDSRPAPLYKHPDLCGSL